MPDWVSQVALPFALPAACHRARCTVSAWWDPAQLGVWYQHGENREHRKFVTNLSFLRGEESAKDWLAEVHEYEAQDAP